MLVYKVGGAARIARIPVEGDAGLEPKVYDEIDGVVLPGNLDVPAVGHADHARQQVQDTVFCVLRVAAEFVLLKLLEVSGRR